MWFIRKQLTRLYRFVRASITIWYDEHIAEPIKQVVHSKPFIGFLMLTIGITWTLVVTVSQYEGAAILRFAREAVADKVRPGAMEFVNPALASAAPKKIAAEPKPMTPDEIKTCQDAVEVYGEKYGVKPLLSSIVEAERDKVKDAKSANPKSTARGCAQFVIGTWELYGKELWGEAFYSKNIYSPKDNVELAAWAISTKGTGDWDASKHVWGK